MTLVESKTRESTNWLFTAPARRWRRGLCHGGGCEGGQLVVPRHGVERLGQVCGALEDDLLGQLLGVAGVAGHQLAQAVEPEVYVGLGQG